MSRFNYLLCICLACLLCTNAHAQREFFEDITLEGGPDGRSDITFRPENNAANQYKFVVRPAEGSLRMDLNSPDAFGVCRFFGSSISDSLILNGTGVGVGDDNPLQPLHVATDGVSFPFAPRARILVEDLNRPPAVRNLLALINNGGTRIGLNNERTQQKWILGTDNADSFFLTMLETGPPSFRIRESGQLTMTVGTDVTMTLRTNGDLVIAGNLNQSSDRNQKRDFAAVDRQQILSKVGELPVSTWSFKSQQERVRHLGPTAQDFRQTFGLGVDDKTISPSDSIGVSLAAIQGLHEQLIEKDARIAELREKIKSQTDEFHQRLEKLHAALASIEQN